MKVGIEKGAGELVGIEDLQNQSREENVKGRSFKEQGTEKENEKNAKLLKKKCCRGIEV